MTPNNIHTQPVMNIGHWFWKTFIAEYLRPTDKKKNDDKELNRWVSRKFKPIKDLRFDQYKQSGSYFQHKSATAVIPLITTYPGLVCGIGYEHEIGFKLGFSFDHTTGLPVIPGSSVKGTMRSCFRHKDYITDCLREIDKKAGIEAVKVDIAKLEKHIFDGIDYGSGKKLPSSKRDVFFDAFILQSEHTDGLFMADDYITSHQNNENPALSPFTEPNPVRFIKVLSNVVFQFSFRLHDVVNKKDQVVLTADTMKKLFERLLKDLGIGAKTNVGYGQFDGDYLPEPTETKSA